MVRSSTLTEEPVIRDIEHSDTVCTEGVTNFHVRLNPAGMALIKSIDPTAICIERYYHHAWAKATMHHARVTKDQLSNLDGFGKLYEWCVDATSSSHTRAFLLEGFPYEIDVKEGSPLVGWLNVMKGVSNG